MERIANARGWEFAKVLAAFCTAHNAGSENLLMHVTAILNISVSTFYRKYKDMIAGETGAPNLARVIQRNPEMLIAQNDEGCFQNQEGTESDFDQAIAETKRQWNDQDLWQDVNSGLTGD